jgi:hypothetical protein
VTADDTSRGCAEVCRYRGIRDLRLMHLHDLSPQERWDTVLMMGGKLGVAGDWEPDAKASCLASRQDETGGVA